ncbi:MAG: sterol desaturase/sphingolipid hydroxylase (fatty acid hydroxylase superfamily) [Oceanospirillaceae bacterium]|jgi:sterol desaturase/sphingolipid hydroxylase (fatty acid hydroxylase superfamily)
MGGIALLSSIISNEAIIRICIFGVFILLFFSWEKLAPWRVVSENMLQRRFTNISLMLISTFFMRLLWPALTISTAYWAQSQQIGLSSFIDLPIFISAIGCFILFDLFIYLQHRLLHLVPFFWRFHRVHHFDTHLDVTSGVRFHPIEAVFSLLLKALIILVLGAPVITVILFEITLNALSLFNHANIKIPLKLDYYLRFLLVTPSVHRVHHSVEIVEHSHNFGFNFLIWDKLFNTYLAPSNDTNKSLVFGQKDLSNGPSPASLYQMLKHPFNKS